MLGNYRIEAIVNQMLQIFAHTNLSHEFIFITIHSGKLTNMSENVLQTIGQLESINVVQSVLHVRIDDQFGQAQDFTTQVES